MSRHLEMPGYQGHLQMLWAWQEDVDVNGLGNEYIVVEDSLDTLVVVNSSHSSSLTQIDT